MRSMQHRHQVMPRDVTSPLRAKNDAQDVSNESSQQTGQRKKRYSIVDLYAFDNSTINRLVQEGCAEMAMLEAWEDSNNEDVLQPTSATHHDVDSHELVMPHLE